MIALPRNPVGISHWIRSNERTRPIKKCTFVTFLKEHIYKTTYERCSRSKRVLEHRGATRLADPCSMSISIQYGRRLSSPFNHSPVLCWFCLFLFILYFQTLFILSSRKSKSNGIQIHHEIIYIYRVKINETVPTISCEEDLSVRRWGWAARMTGHRQRWRNLRKKNISMGCNYEFHGPIELSWITIYRDDRDYAFVAHMCLIYPFS